MIPRAMFVENLLLAKHAINGLPSGAIIECGTWRGGMSAALIEMCGKNRDYYFFDSFEGLPPVSAIDGQWAIEWQNGTDNYNNLTASLTEFRSTIEMSGGTNVKVIPGFFEQSFPKFQPPSIAILRLDVDLYESTMICLRKFWNHVLPGGLILLDDYNSWEGCSRAVHDFLSSLKATEHIMQGRIARVAYIRKKP